jgi:ribonuclease P protein subunit POP4
VPVTKQNLLAHEWIGLHVTIDDSRDPSLRRVSGLVRDETKNTLIIETRGSKITVPKMHTALTANLPSGERLRVEGDLLRFRPEDRIKKRLNKW